MIQRQLLDISYRDILFFLKRLCVSQSETKERYSQRIKDLFGIKRSVFLSLSIRTTFDLILSDLKLEKGSEIILSSITIVNMVDIIKKHHLVPISIDQNPNDLSLNYEQLVEKITPKTRCVLVSHLFGALSSFQPIKAVKDNYPDLIVIEDCAQSFKTVSDWDEKDWVDISLLSFGTIKTMSCFAGSIGFFKNPAQVARLERRYRLYERASRKLLFKKVLKGFCLKLAGEKPIYSFLFSLSKLLGIPFDTVISRTIKGFSGDDLFKLIRKQAPLALYSAIYRRLSQSKTSIYTQQKNGSILVQALGGKELVLGYANPTHCYWVFPLLTNNPEYIVKAMRKIGVDATQNTSHMVRIVDGEAVPLTTIVYIPVHKQLGHKKLLEMAAIIKDV